MVVMFVITLLGHEDHVLMNHEFMKNRTCKVCDKLFGKQLCREKHVLKVHEPMKNWTCKVCDKTFGTHLSLMEHWLKHPQAHEKQSM